MKLSPLDILVKPQPTTLPGLQPLSIGPLPNFTSPKPTHTNSQSNHLNITPLPKLKISLSPSPTLTPPRPRPRAKKSTRKIPRGTSPKPSLSAPRSQHLLVLTDEERAEILRHAQRFALPLMVNSRGKTLENTRNRFENTVRKNTEEEEFAPRIYVRNDIDSEPCPLLDFWFTNKIVYGRDVPKPVKEVGCDCGEICDPTAGNCLCVGLQQVHNERYEGGFAYDSGGRLYESGAKIVECNHNCSCSSRCSNRVWLPLTLDYSFLELIHLNLKVVQRGRTVRLVIQKTQYTGWGTSSGEY